MPGAIGGGPAGGKIYLKFTTRDANVPATLAGTPAVRVYKDDSLTQSTAGITLTVDFDGLTGLNHVTIDTAADGTFYANGHHFEVVLEAGTVGGTSVVGEDVGAFDLAAAVIDASGRVNVGEWLDQAVTLDANNAPNVSAKYWAGTAIAAASIPVATAAGSSGGLAKIGTAPFPASGTIAAAVCDEVNTGATHNVTNSLGKQVRTLAINTAVIYAGTAPSQAGMTSTQIKLDSGASAVDNVYQWDVISITSGTDAGDSAIITAYDGMTKIATVNVAWQVQPDATSVFGISPTAQVQVVSYIAGQDPGTFVLVTPAQKIATTADHRVYVAIPGL